MLKTPVSFISFSLSSPNPSFLALLYDPEAGHLSSVSRGTGAPLGQDGNAASAGLFPAGSCVGWRPVAQDTQWHSSPVSFSATIWGTSWWVLLPPWWAASQWIPPWAPSQWCASGWHPSQLGRHSGELASCCQPWPTASQGISLPSSGYQPLLVKGVWISALGEGRALFQIYSFLGYLTQF